jgi:hypothetical protein
MANDITGNPWRLDTPGPIINSMVHIKNLIWTDGVEADTVVLVDSAGRDVLRAIFAGEGNNNFGEFKWVSGLVLTSISGGQLLVFIHK